MLGEVFKLGIIINAMDHASMTLGRIGNELDHIKGSALLAGKGVDMMSSGAKLAGVGAGILTPIVAAGVAAMGFEKRMAEVNSVVTDGTDVMGKMSDEVLAMGTKYGQIADLMAEATYNIVSAGYGGADAMKVLDLSAKMAIAGLTDVNTAADIGTSVLNAYGMSVEELPRVFDTFSKAIQIGKIRAKDFSQYIGQVAPIAAGANIPIEQLTASIAGMTSAGIKPAEAMTYLRSIIKSIAAPTAEAKKAMEALGPAFQKAVDEGDLVSAVEIISSKADNLAGIKELIPDVEGSTGLMALSNNLDKFREGVKAAQSSAGTMMEMFGENSATAAQKWNELKAAFLEGFIKVGQIVLPIIKDILEYLKPVVSSIADFVKTHPGIVRLAAALGSFLLVLGGCRFVFGAILTTAVKFFNMAKANPWLIALMAITILIASIAMQWDAFCKGITLTFQGAKMILCAEVDVIRQSFILMFLYVKRFAINMINGLIEGYNAFADVVGLGISLIDTSGVDADIENTKNNISASVDSIRAGKEMMVEGATQTAAAIGKGFQQISGMGGPEVKPPEIKTPDLGPEVAETTKKATKEATKQAKATAGAGGAAAGKSFAEGVKEGVKNGFTQPVKIDMDKALGLSKFERYAKGAADRTGEILASMGDVQFEAPTVKPGGLSGTGGAGGAGAPRVADRKKIPAPRQAAGSAAQKATQAVKDRVAIAEEAAAYTRGLMRSLGVDVKAALPRTAEQKNISMIKLASDWVPDTMKAQAAGSMATALYVPQANEQAKVDTVRMAAEMAPDWAKQSVAKGVADKVSAAPMAKGVVAPTKVAAAPPPKQKGERVPPPPASKSVSDRNPGKGEKPSRTVTIHNTITITAKDGEQAKDLGKEISKQLRLAEATG